MSDTNYNSRYLVLIKLLVTHHVCDVFKLKLFSPTNAYATPKLIECYECGEGDTYENLIGLLERIHIES